MSIEDFRLSNTSIDELFDNFGNVERDFAKTFHQKGVDWNGEDQNIDFFGENSNSYQFGNAYLSFDTTFRREDSVDVAENSVIKLVNNGYAFCSKEATIQATGGSIIEKNEQVGPSSTILPVLTSVGQNVDTGIIVQIIVF